MNSHRVDISSAGNPDQMMFGCGAKLNGKGNFQPLGQGLTPLVGTVGINNCEGVENRAFWRIREKSISAKRAKMEGRPFLRHGLWRR